jgi:hypothetical protein
VTTAKIADTNVTTAKLADGAVTLAKIAASIIDSTRIKDGGVGLQDLAPNSVNSAKIQDGSVAAVDLATNSVTTIKIADANVTTAKIAANAIDSTKIVDKGVGYSDLTTAGASNGQVLKYNGTTWRPAPDNSGITVAGTPTAGQYLYFDGAAWIPKSIPTGSEANFSVFTVSREFIGNYILPNGYTSTSHVYGVAAPGCYVGTIYYNTYRIAFVSASRIAVFAVSPLDVEYVCVGDITLTASRL